MLNLQWVLNYPSFTPLAQTIPLDISPSGLAARGTSAIIRIQNTIAQTKKAFNPHSVI